jgi:hypothetical protein
MDETFDVREVLAMAGVVGVLDVLDVLDVPVITGRRAVLVWRIAGNAPELSTVSSACCSAIPGAGFLCR